MACHDFHPVCFTGVYVKLGEIWEREAQFGYTGCAFYLFLFNLQLLIIFFEQRFWPGFLAPLG